MDKHIVEILEESIAVKQDIIANQIDVIVKMVNSIADVLSGGGKLLVFGNGGSAADAQHIAGELVGRFELERSALPAIALTTDSSVITSISNDYSFNEIFSRQIEALGTQKDMALGISTSGSSENVLAGIRKAKNMKLATIGFSGKEGGTLAKITDLCFIAPSSSTPRIQEAHITVIHIICKLVEERLYCEQRQS
ncbi:MAG: D-sedoheptulose 7-phosphate isomerase [bacterium]|nr:D-sedoheptulose 7-phosphate isomerase [bacterium]